VQQRVAGAAALRRRALAAGERAFLGL